MPLIDLFSGEILIAVITILWGIFVEIWYVGKWTVFFNLVPLVVILMTQDLGDFIWVLIVYVFIAIVLSQTNNTVLKQLIGAKSFGTLTLALTLHKLGGWDAWAALGAFIGFSLLVYLVWGILYGLKKGADQSRIRWESQREYQLRLQRQQYFQQYGRWPDY